MILNTGIVLHRTRMQRLFLNRLDGSQNGPKQNFCGLNR